MANSQGFGADAAYERAVGAFDQKSYDVARRWVLEALAQDPEHARARALLSRLDAVRRPPGSVAPGGAGRPSSPFGQAHTPAPEVVSTDPTVLIGHASRTPASEPIEPTIMVQRAPVRRAPAPDPFTPNRPAARDYPPPADPTLISRPGSPPPPAQGQRPRAAAAAASGGFLQRWKDLFGGSGATKPPRPAAPRAASSRPGGLSPGIRGAGLVVGAVVVAALLLFGIVSATRWFWPDGQTLALTKPTGGTLTGPGGLRCGTKGDDCSTTRPTGDAVELLAQADAGFVFSGYTGDCSSAGRVMMSESRKCGARFDETTAPPVAVTFPLTITKPVGGTIVGEPNIMCGSLDTACSANIASGTAVTMSFQAEDKFAFQAFTGDCAANNGALIMNSAKTCGAIFMPAPSGGVINRVEESLPRRPERAQTSPKPDNTAETTKKPPVDIVAPPPPPPPPPPAGGGATQEAQVPPAGPVKREISPEEHAQAEIEDLVKRFCTAHESLKVEGIQKIFPLAPAETYRYQFKQYKTLKCSIASKPEYVRLDARSNGAAQIKFGMKQVIQMRVGGQPEAKETIVTMTLSRTEFKTPWLIDRIAAEEKPK